MPEVGEYLRLAVSNSKTAEAYLKDAECSLHILAERLENCLELLKEIPRDELLLQEQLDAFDQKSQPVDDRELHLVRC
jgi:hypothetical protein